EQPVDVGSPHQRIGLRGGSVAPGRSFSTFPGLAFGPMGGTAAIFDLDRTLLRGASGPVISRALKTAGLLRDRSIPGESFVYRLFDVVGESRPTIELARQAARFSKGWSQDVAREAGRLAADELVDAVQPFARPLIDAHHDAGRVV